MRLHHRGRTLAFVMIAFVLSFFLAHASRAITLIPPSLEYGAKPGETLTTKVKLFNESASPVTLYPSSDNFTVGDDQGTPRFTNTPTEDLASWIKMSTAAVTLQAGDRLDVPVKISVPANADPGGHYAAIFFGTAPTPTPGTSGVSIGNKVGALVIVRVDGTIEEAGTISSFTVDHSGMYSRLPVTFAVHFKNTGNIHVRPAGKITVRNMFGGISTVQSINGSNGAVLPTGSRTFTSTWDKDPATPGRANFFREIGREWHQFAFGPYTAAVDLTYGLSNSNITSANVRFWVFPWRIILVAVLVLALVIVLLVWFVRWYNHMIISRVHKKKRK